MCNMIDLRVGNAVRALISENGRSSIYPCVITQTANDPYDLKSDQCVTVAYTDSKGDIKNAVVRCEDIVPIPLTIGLMLKLGFTKTSHGVLSFKHDKYKIYVDWEDCSVHVLNCGHVMLDFVQVNYVHEVQNLLANPWLVGRMIFFNPFQTYSAQ